MACLGSHSLLLIKIGCELSFLWPEVISATTVALWWKAECQSLALTSELQPMHSFIQSTLTKHLAVLGKEDTQQKRKQSPPHWMNLLASWLIPFPQVHLLLLASFPFLSSPWVLHIYLFGCTGSVLWHMGCSLFHVGSFAAVRGLSSCRIRLRSCHS